MSLNIHPFIHSIIRCPHLGDVVGVVDVRVWLLLQVVRGDRDVEHVLQHVGLEPDDERGRAKHVVRPLVEEQESVHL